MAKMEMLLEWTMKGEKLVEMVKQNSFLYDKKHKDYKKQPLTEQTWTDIAKELDTSTDYVKKRWKTIKDRYYRLKKQKEAAPEKNKVVKYRFYSMLNFLDGHNCSDGSSTYEDSNAEPTLTFEVFKQENFDDYEYQPNDIQYSSGLPNNFMTGVHSDMHTYGTENNDLILSLLKSVKNDSKPMTKERGFCESLALQLEDANLPSENFRNFQISVIQLLSNEISTVKDKNQSPE